MHGDLTFPEITRAVVPERALGDGLGLGPGVTTTEGDGGGDGVAGGAGAHALGTAVAIRPAMTSAPTRIATPAV
jgi:putative effector of murein hydrolase